ncbi:MAG: biotin--[acetyl-CoA-carboxylase] ligase [Thermomonas sp.]|uniref:biotin--[acetyl-CoA-carboxylase] ligase n=1 Tax=Thermomonas sp. TaxID=1971895 RepID=UPI001EC80B89|nr:biotin--[acetyl-CoA-carboxylase] ligase [Thermomonas sp.]MBV2208487.1 biotin--[acetyl-CoA-carboxylase] ligase [Thermomonas sp.]
MSQKEYERALLQRLAAGPVNGDALAQEEGLTRAAVWKRIEQLRQAGVAIEAVAGRGYRLAQSLDLLNVSAIQAQLSAPAGAQIASLDVLWSVDSTNSELLRRAVPSRGCAVLLAERQTAGRGRRGRNWVSPLAAHLYLSLARSFDGGLARLGGLSLAIGVAACEALRALGVDRAQLKWPNDLVVVSADGLSKLGGLLIEGGGEIAGNSRAVIGLGLNVAMPPNAAEDIDQAWSELAALLPAPRSRNALVATLLDHAVPALDLFDQQGLAPFLPRYAVLDALAGRMLDVHAASGVWQAQALGIAEDGALRVRDSEGVERLVHAGDISVRCAKNEKAAR